MWPSTILNKFGIRAMFETSKKKVNGRPIRLYVQAHRLQLFGMEVEDEGHAGGQRSLATGVVRRWKTRKDRCTDLGGDAFEDNGIHLMLHQHELV